MPVTATFVTSAIRTAENVMQYCSNYARPTDDTEGFGSYSTAFCDVTPCSLIDRHKRLGTTRSPSLRIHRRLSREVLSKRLYLPTTIHGVTSPINCNLPSLSLYSYRTERRKQSCPWARTENTERLPMDPPLHFHPSSRLAMLFTHMVVVIITW